MNRKVEKELNIAKQFNKASVVVIIIMLILMIGMTVNTWYLTEQYRWLELKYEELYKIYEAYGK